ncbi:MAG: HAD family hydrolase, partial [Thermoleophilia bacterium]|nr:HAD family hydrolase [Thermoleophilia bacterium]
MTGGPGLVVMDLDGTLVRLAVDWDALRARLRPLAHAAGIEAGGVGTMSAAARRRAGDPAVAALLAALGEAEERGARAAEVDAAVTRAV